MLHAELRSYKSDAVESLYCGSMVSESIYADIMDPVFIKTLQLNFPIRIRSTSSDRNTPETPSAKKKMRRKDNIIKLSEETRPFK